MNDISNRLLLDWDKAFEAGVNLAGGKGWNLARLKRYGFPIPRGYVLSSAACRDFMMENGLCELVETTRLRMASYDNGDEERGRSLKLLRDLIQEGVFPAGIEEALTSKLEELGIIAAPLAVRSSASCEDSSEASFAGIHDSFLNVLGQEQLFAAIRACYASLWTVRAVAYRKKMNIDDGEPTLGVVIMEMVNAGASGVGFSCNPRTGREDEIVINANFGLGESVVGGLVEPDEYRLGQGFFLPEIRETRIGSKAGSTAAKEGGGTNFVAADASTKSGVKKCPVLSDEQIIRLASLITRVFDTLGKGERHQDVEWALAGEDFHLVQARPVTRLPRYTYPALRGQPDIWSNANFRDAIPMVLSTLGRSTLGRVIGRMLETPLRMAGYSILPGVQYLKLHNGRAYYNISVQQWEFYDAFGVTPKETNELLGGHQPEIETQNGHAIPSLSKIVKFYRKTRHLRNIVRARREATQRIAQIRDYCDQCLRRDCTGMSDDEIIRFLGGLAKTHLEFCETSILLSSGSGVFNLLTKTLERDFPANANAVANALLMGNGDITSAEHGYRLLALAECARNDPVAYRFFASEPFEPTRRHTDLPEGSCFRKAFCAFLEEFGHRGVYEADVANPRWREDPSYLLCFIRDVIETADPRKIEAAHEQRRKMTWLKLKEELTWFRFKTIRWLVAQAAKGAQTREKGKSEGMRFLEVFRMVYLEIGRRLAKRGILDQPRDVFHCASSELLALLKGEWEGAELKVLVAERREEKERLETLCPPDLIVGGRSQYISADASASSNHSLAGLGVAAGKASGRTRLITHPREGERLKQGDVLVAPSTDAGWTPLFLKASAIVMETGGFLSHGAIVAREYGIPAVCNVPGAMKLMREDQKVTVDADEGKVYLDVK